jgi:cyclic beta-1,2-glucan synthetase
MFEYLMPNLIMPCYENSMLFESMKFCVYVQKRAFNPWGMSESAFYSFDPNLNYQYKAHGAGKLALKRGQEKECVISPYSSFLALQMVPKSAIKNLKKLSQIGMEGRYGFFEAADFTPMRQLGKKYEIVKCFMAHHLGMSLIAADNAVNDGIMQRRFIRDREMAAYAELLQEKVPIGQIVLRKPSREVPEKPRIFTWQGWKTTGEGVNLNNPVCTLMSNGSYSVALSESGASRSMWRDLMVTRFDGVQVGDFQGMSFYLKIGNETVSLLPLPELNEKAQYSFAFTDRYGEIFAKREEFVSCMNVKVSPDHQGELRSIRINNNLNKSMEAELICYFEPVIAK